MKIVRKESAKFFRDISIVTFGTAFRLLEIPNYWKEYMTGSAMKKTWILTSSYYKDDRKKGLLIVDLDKGDARGLLIGTKVCILLDTTITIGKNS